MQNLTYENTSIPNIDEQIKDAKDTLQRIIGFIGNCDSKSSVVLAVSGVTSLILANSGVIQQAIHIFTDINKSSIFVSIIFIASVFISACLFILGIYKLSCAISANVTCSGKNLRTYFADIEIVDLLTYKSSFKTHSREDILDDLLEQIYVNAIICTRKYKNYNKGLNLIRYAICFFLFTILLGFLLSVNIF